MLRINSKFRTVLLLTLVFVLMLSSSSLFVSAAAVFDPIYPQVETKDINGLAKYYEKSPTNDVHAYMKSYDISALHPSSFTWNEYLSGGVGDWRIELTAPVNNSSYNSFNSYLLTQECIYDFSFRNNGHGYVNNGPYPICTGIKMPIYFYGFHNKFIVPRETVKNYPLKDDNLASELLDLAYQNVDWKLQTVDCNIRYRVTDKFNSNSESDYVYSFETVTYTAENFVKIYDSENIFYQDGLSNAVYLDVDIDFRRPVEIVSIEFYFRSKISSDFSFQTVWKDYTSQDKALLNRFKALISFIGHGFILKDYASPTSFALFKGFGKFLDPSGILSDTLKDAQDFIKDLENDTSFNEFPNIVKDNTAGVGLLGSLVITVVSKDPMRSIFIITCCLMVVGAFVNVGIRLIKHRRE